MTQLLRSLLLWFYCLPIPQAALLAALASALFLHFHQKLHRDVRWRAGILLMLLLWFAAMAYTTLANREGGSAAAHALVPFHSYRAVLNGGNPEILRSNFMNLILFWPAGLLTAALLPDSWPRWLGWLLPLLLLAAVSAGIEYIQYTHALGRAEIDDVIHNTCGGLLGSLWAVMGRKINKNPP